MLLVRPSRPAALVVLASAAAALPAAADAAPRAVPLGSLGGTARASLVHGSHGYGLRITGAGTASVTQPAPAALELDLHTAPSAPGSRLRRLSAGYSSVRRSARGVVATATLRPAPRVRVVVADRYVVLGGTLVLSRRLAVHGSARGGFMSAFTLLDPASLSRADVKEFAPGVLDGSTAHLAPDGRPDRLAIGSQKVFGPGFGGIVRAREDQLGAPLFGALFEDGSSVTLLHADPDGATVPADGTETGTVVDAGLRFGALGTEQAHRRLKLGFWFPGTEGEVSYELRDQDADKRHRWLRREHPLRDGLTQAYVLQVRIGRRQAFPAFKRSAWRFAYGALRPRVYPVDQTAVRTSVAAMLADRFVTTPFGTGIPNDWDAVTGRELFGAFRPAQLGFLGKDVENAALLLQDALQHPGAQSARERDLGTRTIDTFTRRLSLSPPTAAGFDLTTGAGTSFYPDAGVTYLRPVTDDLKALGHLLRLERAKGREHPTWLAWERSFADWLLPQQRADGSLPRAWANGTGRVVDASSSQTELAVPFLLDLATLTGDTRYRRAAIRAGTFAERQYASGEYWGATIDQGDVTSEESGALALEADLALYAATKDRKWLAAARRDADDAEAYIYLWNIPMPAGADASKLAWKPGVPTTGTNLTASGTSGSGEYLNQNVPEFLELGRLTGDAHYTEVGRLLLHDSQAMLALPGRTYDLAGPGWQQEFWQLSPPRGTGSILGGIRDWVPWVAAVKLRAILRSEQLAPAAYAEAAKR